MLSIEYILILQSNLKGFLIYSPGFCDEFNYVVDVMKSEKVNFIAMREDIDFMETNTKVKLSDKYYYDHVTFDDATDQY